MDLSYAIMLSTVSVLLPWIIETHTPRKLRQESFINAYSSRCLLCFGDEHSHVIIGTVDFGRPRGRCYMD